MGQDAAGRDVGRHDHDRRPRRSAILAFGQIKDLPWVVDGRLTVQKVTALALSFDHRIINSELGSLFLREVGAMLADLLRMPRLELRRRWRVRIG